MDLPDLESERDVTDGVEQIGGGYFPGTDDQQERGQDQDHADSRRQQRPQKPTVRALTPKLAASVCPLAVCSPIVPNRVWVMIISKNSAPNTAAATMTRNATNAARPA